jgi:hypothetical protein
MSDTFLRILDLVRQGEVRISSHGYDELAEDGLFATEIIGGTIRGIVVEDYPLFPKGSCVLVLQKDTYGNPVHALWGIPSGKKSPAVLITAYRPDPNQWSDDYRKRLQ